MRIALNPKSRSHNAWSTEDSDEQVESSRISKLGDVLSRSGSNRGSSLNLVDSNMSQKLSSEQFDGFRLYHALVALQSLDIDEDRLQIVEDLDSICSADHLFVSQPRDKIKSTNSEVSFMSEQIIKWLGDLLTMSNRTSDTVVAHLACKILESITFSYETRNLEATKKLFNSKLMETILRAGLQNGVHTECFNILTNCISAQSNEVTKGSAKECIDSLCSSGISYSKTLEDIYIRLSYL